MKRTALVLMFAGSLLFGLACVHDHASAASDQRATAETLQYALEYNHSNEAATWVDPDSGDAVSSTPVNTYRNGSGLYCREYRQTIVIGGKQEQGYGTACRQPDGSWRVVSGGDPAPVPQAAATTQVIERRVYVDDWPYYGYYPRYRYYPYPYYGYPSFLFSFGYLYSSGGHHHGGHRYSGGGHGGGGHGGGHQGGGHGGGHQGGGHGGGRR